MAKNLAEEILEYTDRNGARAVVARGCVSENDQEEADTKTVLHALDATANGATEIRIHVPDTEVFVLALRRYQDLCQNMVFVTGKGETYITVQSSHSQ